MREVIEIDIEQLDKGLLSYVTVRSHEQQMHLAIVNNKLIVSAGAPFSADIIGPFGQIEATFRSHLGIVNG